MLEKNIHKHYFGTKLPVFIGTDIKEKLDFEQCKSKDLKSANQTVTLSEGQPDHE